MTRRIVAPLTCVRASQSFDIYNPGERATQYLQDHSIVNNAFPVGRKDELMQANDGSA
ncbi:MAG: hypothetical protein F6J95_017195 [Leptolyngbya sp. SIO1E4]|nr:hypothetical protein [Leptolyngbya sp. SIO1E4]